MRSLLLFARSAVHATPRQLLWRVILSSKRRILTGLHTLGVAPLGWHLRPAPPFRREPVLRGPVIREGAANERLPLQVNLVGTPWVVSHEMDWAPAGLEKGNRLEKMTLHYMEYLRRLQPEEALLLMGEWAARVEPYSPGYWRDIWNSYTISLRTVEWIDQLSTQHAAGRADVSAAVTQSLAAQVRFLRCNLELDIGGNHLIKNIRALFRAGVFFEGAEAREWLHMSAALLRSQIQEQVLRDGMHFELSPSYHLQVMHDLIDIRRVVWWLAGNPRECGFDDMAGLLSLLDDALRRMAHAGMCLTHPDGMPSLFADGGLHMATPIHLIVHALEAEGVIEKGSVMRPSGAWALPDAGYFGFSGPDELIVIDCGPVGAAHLPAHGHGDCLAIEWSVKGVRVLVDAGVFEYAAGPMRTYSRSTAAHNTVTLDDMDQSEFWSSFRVGRRASPKLIKWEGEPDGFHFAGQHDGYRILTGKPVHRRVVRYAPGKITVTDHVLNAGKHQVRNRLLLGPWVRPLPSRDIEPTAGRLLEITRSSGKPSQAGVSETPFQMRLRMPCTIQIRNSAWSPDLGIQQEVGQVVADVAPGAKCWTWSMEVI